jgi:catechol 2,3-dioxygenase-like lactoylglutathione lyase family enzyme
MVQDRARPQLVGVSHFGFSVTDLDRSIEFYCDVLGATLIRAHMTAIAQRSPVAWRS